MQHSYSWTRYFLLAAILLLPEAAYANPVILSDADLSRAKSGLLPIFIGETLLASCLLSLSGCRFRRVVMPAFVLNLVTFSIFSKFLIIYGRYEIAFSENIILAEIAIVCLEALALYYLGRAAWAKAITTSTNAQLSLGRAVVISALCNIISLVASLVWHFYIEMTYTI